MLLWSCTDNGYPCKYLLLDVPEAPCLYLWEFELDCGESYQSLKWVDETDASICSAFCGASAS